MLLCGALIAGVGSVGEGLSHMNNDSSQQMQSAPSHSTPSLSKISNKPRDGIIDFPSSVENPLQISDKNPADTTSGKITISYKDKSITFSNNVVISSSTIANNYAPVEDQCELSDSGDICLTGTTRIGDLAYDYFALKDVSRNTILKNSKDVKPLDIKDAKNAVSATIDKDSGQSRVVIFSVPGSSVGMLINLGDVSDQVESDFVKDISIKTGN